MRAFAWWLVASACGRVGFDSVATRAMPDAQLDAAVDAPVGTVSWVKVFVGQANTTGTLTDTFTAAAASTGDAIVLQLFCETPSPPTAVSIAAPGWSFTPLSTLVGASGSNFWGESFAAIAPDTTSATFTVTWTSAMNCVFIDELGDDFTGNDQTGGTTTFDAHGEMGTSGNCTASLTTAFAHEAVWAACTTNCVASEGAGYTKGADDAHCDASEWKSTTDPSGTLELPTFASTTQTAYVMTAATIRPR